jgi:hypothetical protein
MARLRMPTVRRWALGAVGALALLAGAAPAGASAGGYAETVRATPGVAGHWRLGEAAGVAPADLVTGATGQAFSVTPGWAGAISDDADTAVRFGSTSSYVALGDGPVLAGDMTVEAWVSHDGRATTRAVVSDGTASTGYHLSLASDGAPVFDVAMNAGGTVTAVSVRGGALTTGVWHHLAATVDATTVTLYADGEPVASTPAAGVPVPAADGLRLGRSSASTRSSTNNPFRGGVVDEVALYGVALDAATVRDHYALATGAAPDTAFAAAPAPVGTAPTATFAFTADRPGTTFQCSLDGAAWGTCASPVTTRSLAAGAHAFQVRGRDRYGRLDGSPAVAAWRIDPLFGAPPAPVTALGDRPAVLSPTGDATFAFSATPAPVAYECSLDGRPWGPCSSPAAFGGLGDGTHGFRVRARDRYGRVEAAPPTATWTVDTRAPETHALAVLPAAVQPTAMLAFASELGARFECNAGGAGWAPCASPAAFPGGLQVAVRAVDDAGNADASPATVTLPPAPAAGPAIAQLTGASAAFSVASIGTAPAECSLDGAAWAACGTTLTLDSLAPGGHRLAVRAALPGGGTADVHADWTVALPAPILVGVQFPVLLYVPPARKIRAASFPTSRLPALRFSLSAAATVRLSLDRTSGAGKHRHLRAWTLPGRTGANVTRLPIELYRGLTSARYRLTAVAAGPAGASAVRTVRFHVVRRTR